MLALTMWSLAIVALLVAPAPDKVKPPVAPAASSSSALKAQNTDDLMKRAKELHAQLEYDQVLPLVQEVLSRDGVSIEQTLDAYVLEGSCLAIVGNTIDAEAPFRRLLRGRPEFELPSDTPPKIMSVFRKVQAEERAIAEQMEALTRARILKEMALVGEHPKSLRGGRPIAFDYQLRDPSGAAQSVRVQYRRKGEPSYSSLALLRDNTGRWRGQIPGEWTANENGTQVEMFIETLDAKGPLLAVGSASEPMLRDVAPGKVDLSKPPPLPPWAVWTGVTTSAALLAAGVGVGGGMLVVQDQYREQVTLAQTVPQSGAELTSKARLGFALSATASSLFIASGVAATATGVAAAFFTDWEGRGESEDASAAPTSAPAASASSAR